MRLAYLRDFPLCADCLKLGTPTPAAHVHHVADRRGRPELALDWSNLAALCVPCHNRKRGDP